MQVSPDDRPNRCLACKGTMYLVCIEVDNLGFDQQTFECSKCGNDENVAVEAAS
jgi:hypothetical protein